MKHRTWWAASMLVIAVVLAACGEESRSDPEVESVPGSPTAPAATVIAAAPTLTPRGPTLTPSPTLPRLLTATPTMPPPPATPTDRPTETPMWREHVVRPGESCFEIAADYGHRDPASVMAIQELNGIRCETLQQGATIKVPLPTPTATEIGLDLTQTAVATNAPPQMLIEVSGPVSVQQYVVVAGDTLLSVADKNNSSMRQICELNPPPEGLNCSSCQWTGPNCCCSPAPLVVVGQRLNVPAPSPTPTASPTFTGSETPTLTPTYRAPEPVLPRAGDTVRGQVRLAWISVGALQEGEQYYVRVTDRTLGTSVELVTRQLSLDVPAVMLPNDGQAHTFSWDVQVVRLVDGAHYLPISQVVSGREFVWEGW